jgi:hypothetical protein
LLGAEALESSQEAGLVPLQAGEAAAPVLATVDSLYQRHAVGVRQGNFLSLQGTHELIAVVVLRAEREGTERGGETGR